MWGGVCYQLHIVLDVCACVGFVQINQFITLFNPLGWHPFCCLLCSSCSRRCKLFSWRGSGRRWTERCEMGRPGAAPQEPTAEDTLEKVFLPLKTPMASRHPANFQRPRSELPWPLGCGTGYTGKAPPLLPGSFPSPRAGTWHRHTANAV